MEKQSLNILRPGKISYQQGLDMQLELLEKRKNDRIDDTLILLEHYPVITAGRRGQDSDIFLSDEQAAKLGVEIHRTDRGGEVTYHGPGQIVGYLILALRQQARKLKKFVYNLEEIFIDLLKKNYQIDARHDDQHTGTWIGDKKITAIGISIKNGITMHGFAFNVNTNLNHFNWIVPCGITDKGVTSLEEITGKKQDIQVVQDMIIKEFKERFEYA